MVLVCAGKTSETKPINNASKTVNFFICNSAQIFVTKIFMQALLKRVALFILKQISFHLKEKTKQIIRTFMPAVT